MQIMVVYLYDVPQNLQGICMVLICLLFLAIQIGNRRAYFNPELNKMNLNIQIMIFVWTFTRFIVRTHALDGAPDEEGEIPDRLLSSNTGLPLPEIYNVISRSSDLNNKGNDTTFIILMIPVLFQMMQIESTFIWRFII